MAKRGKWIDPLVPRKSEVVLTGYDSTNQVCFQEVLGYEEYYEEVGHIFERDEELARLGIRRIHFAIWGYRGKLQAEHENDYDELGNQAGGRMRDNPQQAWVEDRK